jgi:glutathione S-transferase
MKLYNHPFSPNSRKVRAVAAELGLPLELVDLDIAGGETRKPPFLAINPNAKVPVLDDDGFVLWESNAICAYLATKQGKLIKTDAKGRADVDRWLFWQTAHLGVAIGKVWFNRVFMPMVGGPVDEAAITAGTNELARLLPVLDEQLSKTDWVCGELSVADFAIGVWLDLAEPSGLTLSPKVSALLGRLRDRPSFAQSVKR